MFAGRVHLLQPGAMASDMDSLRAAVAVPIQVDDQDILNLEDRSGNVPSPTKRSRWDERAGAGISLADLTAALSPLTQGVLEVKQRVTDIEAQFATKVNKTLDLIQSLNDRQRDQGDKLQKIQEAMEAQKEQDRKHDSAIQDILQRVDQLEDSSMKGATWRQPLFEGEQGVGPRTPALVMGGWNLDLEGDDVKSRAEKMVKDLNLDIDLGEAFMPGRQKGFLIVPLLPKVGEDRARLQRRAIGAVESVRKAACHTGTVDSAGAREIVDGFERKPRAAKTHPTVVQNQKGSARRGGQDWQNHCCESGLPFRIALVGPATGGGHRRTADGHPCSDFALRVVGRGDGGGKDWRG